MACGVCGVLRVSFGAAVGVAVIVGEHREWTVYKNHNKSQKKPAKPANLCNFLKTHSFHRRVSLDRNPQKPAKTRRSVLLCGPHSWTLGAFRLSAPPSYTYFYSHSGINDSGDADRNQYDEKIKTLSLLHDFEAQRPDGIRTRQPCL